MIIYYTVFRHQNGRQKWPIKMTSVLPEISVFTPMKVYVPNNGQIKKKFSKITVIFENYCQEHHKKTRPF